MRLRVTQRGVCSHQALSTLLSHLCRRKKHGREEIERMYKIRIKYCSKFFLVVVRKS